MGNGHCLGSFVSFLCRSSTIARFMLTLVMIAVAVEIIRCAFWCTAATVAIAVTQEFKKIYRITGRKLNAYKRKKN
jgi:hypothetical protein